jgi:HSP20 family protein
MMTMYISPYRRIASLRQAMDRLIDESLVEAPATEREMLLAVDVKAEDEGYEVTAMVPGLEADDLNIEVLNNTITIRGEFKGADQEADYVAHELPHGRFMRVLTLPVVLDSAKAEASIKDGLLTLRVPKAEAHRPKAIKVHTANQN